MKFGRVHDLRLPELDLSLPPDAGFTTSLLARLPQRTTPPNVYFGCPVWGHKPYVGTIYPPGTKQPDFLKAYGQQFNTIELNSTHYGVPPVAQIEKWADAVPDHFRFCPKWPQRISHRSRVDEYIPMIDQFLESIYAFGEKLGTTFIQLPPWYTPDAVAGPTAGKRDGLQRLHRFLEALPADLQTAVEFRHENWFNDPVITNELFGMLETVGAAAVITDVAGRRDVCHMGLTTAQVFVRFTGNNLHPTDYPRATAWAERIATWLNSNFETVYFLFHQPDEEHCGEMADHFIGALNKSANLSIKPPFLYHRQQQELF